LAREGGGQLNLSSPSTLAGVINVIRIHKLNSRGDENGDATSAFIDRRVSSARGPASMIAPTVTALLLAAAGLLQSLALMCRKLPEKRRPAIYPTEKLPRLLFDIAWIPLFIVGILYAFQLGGILLGVIAMGVYFVILPFVFQLPLANMLGFKNFKEYLRATESKGKK
jgi:hypothetical protein